VTVEALALVLQANPRGVLVARDELGAWAGSFDAYTKAAKDVPCWLELHRAGHIKVDRKGSPPIRVRQAAASVTGTIQPSVLQRIMKNHIEDGLLARFLLAAPPPRSKRWTEAAIPGKVISDVDYLFSRLVELNFEDEDNHTPVTLTLDADAKATFISWYDEHAIRQAEAEPPLSYTLSKIEEVAARLALIFSLVQDPGAKVVGVKAMKAGITAARWFADEAERIYATWSETKEERAERELLEWIDVKGGTTAAKLARSGPRKWRGKPKEAEQKLEQLADAGSLIREANTSGQPTTVYRVDRIHSSPETPESDQRQLLFPAATIRIPVAPPSRTSCDE